MTPNLTDIRQRVSALADSAGTLEAYKTLADTLKSLSDSEKATKDAANQERLLRFEGLKSTATIIVPLLTLLTLAITVYFQWSQAIITTQANEDAQWRGLSDAMTKPAGITSDVVVTTGLIPFYKSARYRDQAYQIVFLLARRVTDANAFRVLYDTAFGGADWSNAADNVRLARVLDQQFSDIDGVFEQLGGAEQLDADAKKRKTIIPTSNGPFNLDQANHARNEVLNAQEYLSDRIGELLRGKRPPGALPYSDFTGLSLYRGNLAQADFSDLDIGGSDFQKVDLHDALLFPSKFENSTWIGTKW